MTRYIGFIVTFLVLRLCIKLLYQHGLYEMFQNETVNIVNKRNILITIIFLSLAFFIQNYKKIKNMKEYKVDKRASYVITSVVLFLLYYTLRYFTTGSESLITGILRMMLLFVFGIFVFLSFFGIRFVMIFKKEIMVLGVIGIVYYYLTTYFQYSWFIFSVVVTRILGFMFSLLYKEVWVHDISSFNEVLAGGGPVLGVSGFSARIGAPCSGTDSLLMFLSLLWFILIIDFNKLNLKRYMMIMLLGCFGIFLVNIIRIFLLFLVGIHISPGLAVGFFHSNIGWILFIAYFGIFWWMVSRYVYKKRHASKRDHS